MSWPFGGRTRTFVATSAGRVIEPLAVPDIPLTALIKAPVTGLNSNQQLEVEVLTSLAVKMQRAVQYAKTHYTYGLPNHTYLSESSGTAAMQAYVETLHSGPVTLIYHRFNALNPMHVAWQRLTNDFGFNEETNTVDNALIAAAYPSLTSVNPVYVEHVFAHINTDVTSDFFDPNEANGDELTAPWPYDIAPWNPLAVSRYLPWTNPHVPVEIWKYVDNQPTGIYAVLAFQSTTTLPNTAAETLHNEFVLDMAQQVAAHALRVQNGTDVIENHPDPDGFKVALHLARLKLTHTDDFVVRHTVNLSLAGFTLKKAHFQAKYAFTGANGLETRFLTIEYGANAVPTLDAAIDQSAEPSQFLPFVLFRENKVNLLADAPESDQVKTAIKLCKILDIDYEAFNTGIHDTTNNPKIGLVSEAVLLFAIPMTTTELIGQRYLFHFFDFIAQNNTWELTLFDQIAMSLSTFNEALELSLAEHERFIQRSIVVADGRFSLQINWKGLSKKVKSGTIFTGATGTKNDYSVTSEIITVPYPDYFDAIMDFAFVDSSTGGYQYQVYTLKRQITPAYYEEIIVTGLDIVYPVAGERSLIPLEDQFDRLLIPVSNDIALEFFEILDRNTLYAQAMHMVFNSKEVKKLEFYETEFFRGLLFIAAFVITVASLGQAAPATVSFFSSLVVTYGVVAGTLLFATLYAAFNYVVNELYAYIAEELGAEYTFWAAIAALVAAAYGASKGAVWADRLLMTTGNMQTTVTEQLRTELNQLQLEMDAFEQQIADDKDALDRAQNELGNPSPVPLMLELATKVEPFLIDGETPDEFYARTVNAGNVGAKLLDETATFVDTLLELPEPQDTLIEFNLRRKKQWQLHKAE